MEMTITVRTLPGEELAWANERYAEIDFVPSSPADYMAMAEVDNELAGLVSPCY
ncbi:hypothetical protein [Massilia cavernae]|uniref:hypothetical protein n=1 Tax=Massilia cavernae TaxID=2320864 RepID=UPI001600B5F3|nr:hypothetical protein [Massilia cavernae]